MEVINSFERLIIFESSGSVYPDSYFQAKSFDSSFLLSCKKLKLISLYISSQRSAALLFQLCLDFLGVRSQTIMSFLIFELQRNWLKRSLKTFIYRSLLFVLNVDASLNTLAISYFSMNIYNSSGEFERSHLLNQFSRSSAREQSLHQLYSRAFFKSRIDSLYLKNFLFILAIISKNYPIGCNFLQYSQKIIAIVEKKKADFQAPASSKEEAMNINAQIIILDYESNYFQDIRLSQSIDRASTLRKTILMKVYKISIHPYSYLFFTYKDERKPSNLSQTTVNFDDQEILLGEVCFYFSLLISIVLNLMGPLQASNSNRSLPFGE